MSISRDNLIKATNEDIILQELKNRIRGAKINLMKRKSQHLIFDHLIMIMNFKLPNCIGIMIDYMQINRKLV
ncbi:hypothetical protein BpHYR1_038930 [Brachionus plicatilis]|uniref:Uncharacterized protein n=1 Tax=Brachionus plicatilis TaxID=10195 RepID=A0A3M7QQM7_BRAPC|nr:hypothetical protein BpHYR1_038930 [Brachionus plicatilis]